MDIIAFLNSGYLAEALQSTRFTVNEAERSVDVWARAARCTNLALNPEKNYPQDDTTKCSVVSGACSRGHIDIHSKAQTKMRVIHIVPRDEFG